MRHRYGGVVSRSPHAWRLFGNTGFCTQKCLRARTISQLRSTDLRCSCSSRGTSAEVPFHSSIGGARRGCYPRRTPDHHEPQGGPLWLPVILAGWSGGVSRCTGVARIPTRSTDHDDVSKGRTCTTQPMQSTSASPIGIPFHFVAGTEPGDAWLGARDRSGRHGCD